MAHVCCVPQITGANPRTGATKLKSNKCLTEDVSRHDQRRTDWRVVLCLCPLSCRKRHRLSRLESFTKRVSKRKLFTLAGYSQEAALLNLRWLPDLWPPPGLGPPSPAADSSAWRNTSCLSCWVFSASLPTASFSFFHCHRHAELATGGAAVEGCVAQAAFFWLDLANQSLLLDTPHDCQ